MENPITVPMVVEIEGILIPNQWNSQNKVTSIVLSSPGEKEYCIDQSNQSGKELLNHLSQKVRLKGNLRSYQGNKQLLEVTTYEVVEW